MRDIKVKIRVTSPKGCSPRTMTVEYVGYLGHIQIKALDKLRTEVTRSIKAAMASKNPGIDATYKIIIEL